MIEWAIACISSVLTESPSQYPATFIHIWFMLNKNERITLITQCLYLLSSYCAQLKSYMLAELLILLSSFLRLNGALKLIRIESCDGISASEKQHSPVCLYTHTHTHTSGPSPQKQRSFCQELTVAGCLSRLLVDGQGLTLSAWRVFLPWCRMCEGLFPICQACTGTRQGWKGLAGLLLVLCKHTCALSWVHWVIVM